MSVYNWNYFKIFYTYQGMNTKHTDTICCQPSSLGELQAAYLRIQEKYRTLQNKLTDTKLQLNDKADELDVISYYLNSILSNMAEGLLFINLEGYVSTYNQAAADLIGIPVSEILFHSFCSHLKDDYFGFSLKQVLIDKQAPSKSNISIQTTQGSQKEIEVTVSMMLTPNIPCMANLQGIIILMRDVTELRRLQEMAQRRDRLQALGEMASLVAHEIRNPLGSIKGFASLLSRDLEGQPGLQRMSKDIVAGTDALNRLVTNVLNYSRPIHLHAVTADLVAEVREICRQVEADPSLQNNVQLIFQSPLVELTATYDPAVLKSALLNLIANGIQAMPQGGKLVLEVDKDGNQAVIKISDTGTGIASENMKKLFMPFFTTKETGNGFGLMEVQKVVQAHFGTIDVKSTVGQGTSFIIKLPLR